MAITKLLPAQWQATFGHIEVDNETNMYTDVSSSTYSFVEVIGSSVYDVRDFYLGGFEKHKIPAGSEVTGYTVRIKIANAHGRVDNAGISLYNGVGSSIDEGAIIPGTTLTNVGSGTFTLPTDGVGWDVINSLVQSGKLYIHIPIQTLSNDSGGGIRVYGAEIEVTYELPEKYVTGRRLQRFWDNAKNYIDTEIPTNVSDLQNDAGYLTQHQSLSDYALKSEIPTIPTNVSAFTNDSGYINDLSPYIYYSQNSNTVYINSATEITDADEVTTIEDEIGDLSQLTTTAKDNLVSAINEENEAIAGINERLDEVTIPKTGANINTVGYEGGYIASNGTDTSAASYETVAFRSNGYIPVTGGKTLYWWGKLSDGVALGALAVIVEYDESKNLIGERHPFNKYRTTADNQAFTLSDNAAYVRIALYQGVEDKSTIQIAIYYDGNEQAAYVPPQDISVLNYEKIYNASGESADKILSNKLSNVGITPIYDYEEITVTGESGALMPDGTIRDTTDVTRYKIPVLKGERYVVSARHGYAYRAFLVLDANDNILSYYPTGTSGTAIHRNVSVDIEENGFLVLQNVYNFMPVLGKVSKYTSNDKLYQKSIYWNGDSVCFGAGGKSFADQISLAHAMPETMDAVSGTRLSTRSGRTDSIYDRVVAMDTTAEYDFIGIEGGYNDYFSSVAIGALMANYTDSPDTTTVIGAVEGICKHIRTNFPNSKYFFVLGHRPTAVGAYPTDVDTYWNAIITALEKWAVPYVDIRKEGTLMAYNSDWLATYFGEGETMGTHPNALGYKTFYNDLVESKMQSI